MFVLFYESPSFDAGANSVLRIRCGRHSISMSSVPELPIALTTDAKAIARPQYAAGESMLGKLGVRTAQDLLFLFPREYELPAPSMRVDELKRRRGGGARGRNHRV